MSTTTNKHFATLEGDALAAEMVSRFTQFITDLRQCHDLRRMRLGFLALYGEDEQGANTYETTVTGQDGQARILKSNQLRVHLLQRINLATADLPDMKPVPTNTDADSQAQAQLSEAVLNCYRKEKQLDETALETMLIGEALLWAWLDTAWDETMGEVVSTVPSATDAEGNVTATSTTYAGDVRARPVLPIDCAFDIRRRDGEVPWVIIRRWVNKYDAAASYLARTGDQDTANNIVSLTGSVLNLSEFSFIFGPWTTQPLKDDIEVLELRHMPCPSAPLGRRALLVGEKYFLSGGTLKDPTTGADVPDAALSPDGKPAKDLGIYRYDAGRRIGSPRGYSAVADVTGTQTAIDVLTSIPYTNQRGLGGNVVWTPEGSGLSYNKLSEALAYVTTKSIQHKPEVLNLLATPREVFEFRSQLIAELGTALGMDAVSMGTAKDITSGADFAARDSVTQRNVSGPAKAFVRMLQSACENVLRLLRQHATSKRSLPLIVGKAKAPMMKSFSAEDLGDSERLSIEAVPAALRMTSGRVAIAQMLLGAKAQGGEPLINEQQFMSVVNTGKLEPLTEAPMNELLRIRSENERLATGEVLDTPPPTPEQVAQLRAGAPPPPVTATARVSDNHPQHIREHLAAGTADDDPRVAANRYAHVQAHINLWRSADPAILFACQVPPPPPPPLPPGVAPPGAPGPAGPPPPSGGGGPPSGPPHAPSGPPSGAGPQHPNLPNMPQGPGGERYSPTAEVNANV